MVEIKKKTCMSNPCSELNNKFVNEFYFPFTGIVITLVVRSNAHSKANSKTLSIILEEGQRRCTTKRFVVF